MTAVKWCPFRRPASDHRNTRPVEKRRHRDRIVGDGRSVHPVIYHETRPAIHPVSSTDDVIYDMPGSVFVPVDGSSQSIGGLAYAFETFPSAAITVLYVRDRKHDTGGDDGGSPAERADPTRDPHLERAIAIAAEYNREIETAVETGRPHREIVEYAIEHGVDHVVIGSHGESSVAHPFLGRVSYSVLRRAPVSTTVIPESLSELRERELPGRVLVPVDGSEQSIAALEYACGQFSDGRVTVLHAVTLPFE